MLLLWTPRANSINGLTEYILGDASSLRSKLRKCGREIQLNVDSSPRITGNHSNPGAHDCQQSHTQPAHLSSCGHPFGDFLSEATDSPLDTDSPHPTSRPTQFTVTPENRQLKSFRRLVQNLRTLSLVSDTFGFCPIRPDSSMTWNPYTIRESGGHCPQSYSWPPSLAQALLEMFLVLFPSDPDWVAQRYISSER